MASEASIVEIFGSLQGEGPYVGERHLFVRFQDCELSCRYCDTPLSFAENKFCRIEHPPFSKRLRHIANPLSVNQINEVIRDFSEKTLNVTGGEPLQNARFLGEWLQTIRPRFRIILETAGIHFAELREVIGSVDVISMDFKLPSATGMHPWWREHETFLKIAREKETYIKVVVTADTTDAEIMRSAGIIASVDPEIPVILQPAFLSGRFRAVPTIEQLASWQEVMQNSLRRVRIIPQMHKQLGIL